MSKPAAALKTADEIRERFSLSAAAFRCAAESEYPEALARAAKLLVDAFTSGNKVLAFGNGGSASDALHLCGELVVRFEQERRALPAIALCCDPAVLTACGNDYSFAEVYARQVQALGKPGDVALAISTSGKSPNILRALEVAKSLGMKTVVFTGSRPAPAWEYADVILAAPAEKTAYIQELHLASYHAICAIIDACFKRAS